MKVNKFLMLGIAGLAFAACSNEEEVANNSGTLFPDGNGALSIRIVNPVTTRSSAQTTSNVTVTGPVVITLEDANGFHTISLTADELAKVVNEPEEGQQKEQIRFWNVQGPKKVIVAMNGGQYEYTDVSINDNSDVTMIAGGEGTEAVTHKRDMQAVQGVAAYGETDDFVAAGLGTPDVNDDIYEEGATAGDEGKQYEMFTATVNLTIPVARLEVSGITHVQSHIGADGTTDDCKYATLTIDGVYMDNVLAKGALSVAQAKETEDDDEDILTAERTGYRFPGDVSASASGDDAILNEVIPSESFLQLGKTWPAAVGEVAQAYGFNFYAPTTAEAATMSDASQEQINAINPQFKVFFKNATGKGTNNIAAPRYAMITKYRSSTSTNPDDKGIILEAGKVYRITSAVLDDENIIGTEDGSDLYGVNVTVEEAVWTVENINANWAK